MSGRFTLEVKIKQFEMSAPHFLVSAGSVFLNSVRHQNQPQGTNMLYHQFGRSRTPQRHLTAPPTKISLTPILLFSDVPFFKPHSHSPPFSLIHGNIIKLLRYEINKIKTKK